MSEFNTGQLERLKAEWKKYPNGIKPHYRMLDKIHRKAPDHRTTLCQVEKTGGGGPWTEIDEEVNCGNCRKLQAPSMTLEEMIEAEPF